jgi:carnitine O-acetyltransferase
MSTSATSLRNHLQPTLNSTWAHQDQLPKLPIPPLGDTCRRYLAALKGLQDEREHENTKRGVATFLNGDGPRAQEMLIDYAKNKDRCVICYTVHHARCLLLILIRCCHSYIEEFWYERLQ